MHHPTDRIIHTMSERSCHGATSRSWPLCGHVTPVYNLRIYILMYNLFDFAVATTITTTITTTAAVAATITTTTTTITTTTSYTTTTSSSTTTITF